MHARHDAPRRHQDVPRHEWPQVDKGDAQPAGRLQEDVLRRDMFIGQPLSRSNCKTALGAECASFMFTSPFSNPLQPEQTLISEQQVSCRGENAQPKVELAPM